MCKGPWEDTLNTCDYFAPGKGHRIHSIKTELSGRSFSTLLLSILFFNAWNMCQQD